MHKFGVLLFLLFLTGCVSFKPVDIGSYYGFNSTVINTACGKDASDICKSRAYARSAAEKYRKNVLDLYDVNSEFDSSILNLVTVGVGAELASASVDVIKSAALLLGYQTARKTYQSIPFQLQVYTDASTAAQCVYDASKRLETGYNSIDDLNQILRTLNSYVDVIGNDYSKANTDLETIYISSADYNEVRTQILDAIELATQARDVLEYADSTIVSEIQNIDTTVLKRFNGQLPDINEIKNKVRHEVEANMMIDDKASLIMNPPAPKQGVTRDNSQNLLFDAMLSIERLKRLRVEKYIKSINEVSGCSAAN